MPRCIALLRGINVGGNTMIKMEELRAMFEALQFENVATYINSGNLAFDILQKPARSKGTSISIPNVSKGSAVSSPHVSKGSSLESDLVSKIESAILEAFAKTISVMVREQPHIRTVLDNNPFVGEFESHKEMHVLFMKDEMPVEKQNQLLANQTDDERFVIRGREIYCHLKFGVADSLLGKGFIEKKLKTAVTARNWRTVEKLADL